MTDPRLIECLLLDRPYFGSAMRALQGVAIRHAYMQAVVELLSKENHTEPIKILEVGSWAGGTAITWAKAVQKYFGRGQVLCVDHWEPYFDTSVDSEPVYVKMTEAAVNKSIYGLFLHNIRTSGVSHIVSHIVGNSHCVLPTLEKSELSIAYLDASHKFSDVERDIRLSMDLVREGGVLCGDDLELQCSDVGAAELIADVATRKDYVRSRACNLFYHPGVTHAVAATFGEVSAWEGFWAMRKTAKGWVTIDLSGCEITTPDHISSTESDSTESSNDTGQLITMISQIAKQSTDAAPTSEGCAQDVPELIGSYYGFNIVRFRGAFYGVRQSLGEIDWSLSDAELARRYNGSDFFVCSDTNAIVNGIGLNEFRFSIEKLFSLLVERDLRQEAVIGSLARRIAETAERLAQLETAVVTLTRAQENTGSEAPREGTLAPSSDFSDLEKRKAARSS